MLSDGALESLETASKTSTCDHQCRLRSRQVRNIPEASQRRGRTDMGTLGTETELVVRCQTRICTITSNFCVTAFSRPGLDLRHGGYRGSPKPPRYRGGWIGGALLAGRSHGIGGRERKVESRSDHDASLFVPGQCPLPLTPSSCRQRCPPRMKPQSMPRRRPAAVRLNHVEAPVVKRTSGSRQPGAREGAKRVGRTISAPNR
jgi:hypothetical protein